MACEGTVLRVEQGTSFARQITWEKPKVPADPNDPFEPVDLTGCEMLMQVRLEPGSPVIIELSTDDGQILITDALGGIFTMSLTPAETAALTPGWYKFDLLVTFPNTDVVRLLEGTFHVSPSVTVWP